MPEVLTASDKLASIMVFGGHWAGDPYNTQDIEGWHDLAPDNWEFAEETCCVYNEDAEQIIQCCLNEADAWDLIDKIQHEDEEDGTQTTMNIYTLPEGWLTAERVAESVA